VQPDAVADQEVELFIADLVGPGIRSDGFSNDGDPVPARAVFEQLGFKTQTTSHPFEDAGERVDGAESSHGGIIAKTALAISSQLPVSFIWSIRSVRFVWLQEID
jgi:hypothetical protein